MEIGFHTVVGINPWIDHDLFCRLTTEHSHSIRSKETYALSQDNTV